MSFRARPYFLLSAFLAIAPAAWTQAWVPPAGVGAISISFQRISNDGHRLTNGFLVPAGQSLNMGLYLEAEYSFTNRFSVAAGLPFVFSKYTDPNPPPPPIPYLANDQCHCWQSGWQDWGLTARYNIVNAAHGAFVLTPSVSAGVPSHSYEFRGESALGRDLRELRIGIDSGQRLDRLLRNFSVQERYTYGFVEKVGEVSSNRSNVTVEGAYLMFKGKLATRGFASWQRTHGGLRLGSIPPTDLIFPGEVNTPELLFQHDRLLRDNNLHSGGGLSYSFPKFDAFAFYNAYVSGTDTHAGGALTLGVSWQFEIARR